MRFSKGLVSATVIVLGLVLLAGGCTPSSTTDEDKPLIFKFPDGSIREVSPAFGTLWSLPRKAFLGPDQWNSPQHQQELKDFKPADPSTGAP